MSLYVVCMSVNRSAECRLTCLSSYIVCRFDFLALYLQNKTVSKFVQISLRCIHCRTPTALLPPTPLCISEDRFRKQCWYRLAMPVLRCSAAMFGEPHFGSIDLKLLFFPSPSPALVKRQAERFSARSWMGGGLWQVRPDNPSLLVAPPCVASRPEHHHLQLPPQQRQIRRPGFGNRAIT